jgi:hypothetical protein
MQNIFGTGKSRAEKESFRFFLSSRLFLFHLISSILIMPQMAYAQSGIPAFPGAEGYGANTIGGRGGKIYIVSNLNDSGTGSLRECVNATVPRICVFKVGGTITLTSTLSITSPNITIAGQSAPGGGILLRAAGSFTGDLMNVSTREVIIRYITFRRGPPSAKADTNNLSFYKYDSDVVYNFIVDHCSFSWSTDRLFYTWYGARDYSVQWNLFAEPLNCSTNSKTVDLNTCHSKGVMFGSYSLNDGTTNPVSRNVSYHHNLLAQSYDRNPLIKTTGVTDIVNNVDYNTGNAFSTVDLEHQIATIPINYVKNYFKVGPGTKSTAPGIKVDNASYSNITDPLIPRAKLYQLNNVKLNLTGTTTTGLAFLNSEAQAFVIPARLAAPAINETTAEQAYTDVLANSGNNRGLDANGNWILRRDAVDRRIINEAKTGKGKIIDAPWFNTCFGFCRGSGYYLTAADYSYPDISAAEINPDDGWPVIAAGTPYPDADSDGMSDVWEANYGVTDPNADNDHDGYTNIEEFLNGTDPGGGTVIPTSTPALTPTPVVSKPGDANGDGLVNVADMVKWINGYIRNTTGLTNGDFDGNGKTDGRDFTVWLSNYGK